MVLSGVVVEVELEESVTFEEVVFWFVELIITLLLVVVVVVVVSVELSTVFPIGAHDQNAEIAFGFGTRMEF